jgi:hypothetical protein
MAVTTRLALGIPDVLLQNIVYSLPSFRCLFHTDATSPTLVQSETQTFTANSAITLTNNQIELAGGFLKCTSGNINFTLKKT